MALRLTPAQTLRRVASQVSGDLRARLVSAADAVETANPVSTPVVEAQDPISILKEHEEAVKEAFEGKSPKDKSVQAVATLDMTLATWVQHLDDMLEALPVEDEDLAEVRGSIEDIRSQAEGLYPWAQAWKDTIQASDLESAIPKFPKMPKNVMPSPAAEVTEAPVVEEPEEEEETEKEEEEGSLLDEIAGG